MNAWGAFVWALRRDLRLAVRRSADALNVLGFFVLACSMFPLAIGPQREWLARIGPGAIWVAALLSVMLAFSLPTESIPVLIGSLLLGTPVLLCIGAIASALTLGLKGGPTLVTMLCLPLDVPVLVFGSGAVEAQAAALSSHAHLALLGAGMLLSGLIAPFVAALALRISVE